MPDEHARLSPSAAHRWLACPASLQLVEQLELDTFSESFAAAEGTHAHELAEIEASAAFRLISSDEHYSRVKEWRERGEEAGFDTEEMEQYIEEFLLLLVERMALYPDSHIFLEQRLPTGLPESFGTSDVVIVSPHHVEIIDLKYGKGEHVVAYRNPQLRLYALGALDTFGELLGETEIIRLTICQPRMASTTTEELTPGQLRAWRDYVLPIAEEALYGDSPRFGPSEKACRWCPAKGVCKPRAERMLAFDFGTHPDTMSPEELGDVLGQAKELREWVNDVEAVSLDLAYSKGVPVPGWKVVRSGGQRKITDQEAALARLVEAGFDEDEVLQPPKVLGVTALDKLLKPRKLKLADVLGETLQKTEGSISLVPEADKREGIGSSAEQDFEPYEEET